MSEQMASMFGFARFRRIPMVECKGCDWYRRVGSAGDVCLMHERLATLAHNLAVGAALCRAWDIGWRHGYESCPCGDYYDADQRADIDERHWRPGCQRSAP